MDGKIRGLGRGVIFIGKGFYAAGTFLLGLDGVPAFQGVAQIRHGLSRPGIGNPDGKAQQIRAVILPAVAKDHNFALLRRKGATGLSHSLPDLFALRSGKIKQYQNFMGGLGITEYHGIKFLTPVPPVGGLALNALMSCAQFAEHLRGFGGHQPGIGQLVMQIGIKDIDSAARH